jgi:hypothetical protein
MRFKSISAAVILATGGSLFSAPANPSQGANPFSPQRTFYRTAQVDGPTIFYREAGPKDAPVGYRLALQHPERLQALIVRNGNAYLEGIDNDFFKPIKALE